MDDPNIETYDRGTPEFEAFMTDAQADIDSLLLPLRDAAVRYQLPFFVVIGQRRGAHWAFQVSNRVYDADTMNALCVGVDKEMRHLSGGQVGLIRLDEPYTPGVAQGGAGS